MRTALLLLLVGCAAREPYPPAVPAPPVLDPVAPVQHRRMFKLRGNVAADAAVRLYTDSACAGPVYLQTTGVSLKEGVEVELITGVDNAFSADAVSGEGGVSACSQPLTLQYVPALRPGQPSVSVMPTSPSNATRFTLRGAIDSFARAQLHEGTCSGPVLGELDAAAFFNTGFPVDAPVNGSHTVAVDAVNDDQRSVCVAVTVINDSRPPQFSARLASPTPSSNGLAYVVLSGEPVRADVYEGPSCAGTRLGSCCSSPIPFFPSTTTFSVLGSDGAGNTTCVMGSKAWEYDASVPLEQAIVLLPGNPTQVEVPVGPWYVEVFFNADCSAPLWWTDLPTELANRGLYLAGFSPGFVTARGVRADGGVDPCSNAVPVGP